MKSLASFLVAACISLPAFSDDIERNAAAGQLSDVGSTAIGLAVGATEANPLGIVSLALKAAVYQKITEAPETERPELWGMYGALGWGATANNICVISTAATGVGILLCPLIGLIAGTSVYAAGEEERNRATFAAICDQKRKEVPTLSCEFKEAAK